MKRNSLDVYLPSFIALEEKTGMMQLYLAHLMLSEQRNPINNHVHRSGSMGITLDFPSVKNPKDDETKR